MNQAMEPFPPPSPNAETPTPEIMLTNRGKHCLLYKDNIFNHHRTSTSGDRIRWRCRGSKTCKGFMITSPCGEFLHLSDHHDHEETIVARQKKEFPGLVCP